MILNGYVARLSSKETNSYSAHELNSLYLLAKTRLTLKNQKTKIIITNLIRVFEVQILGIPRSIFYFFGLTVITFVGCWVLK